MSLYRAFEALLPVTCKKPCYKFVFLLKQKQTRKPVPVMTTQQSLSDISTCFDTQTSVCLPKVSSNTTMLASGLKTSCRKPSFIDHATPAADVSAFCRSVLEKLVPHEFWGVGDAQSHNRRLFMRNVDRFIRLRRFESLSLHDTCQGMKVG